MPWCPATAKSTRFVTRFTTSPDGLAIAYDAVGAGPPIVLIHGFAASRAITWRGTLWYDWLTRAGHTVIALDCRGHGESDKPHDAASYDDQKMLGDILAVMAAEDISRADVMGYSMGGYLTINLAHERPDVVTRAVIAGVGENYFSFWAERDKTIAEGLLAKDESEITDPLAQEFRAFAEKGNNDLKALAACMLRRRLSFTASELRMITTPALIAVGELDSIAGLPDPLASVMGNARGLVLPRRNHHSAVGDLVYKRAVKDFFGSEPEGRGAP